MTVKQLMYFSYDDLPEGDPQEVGQMFHDLARQLVDILPDNQQRKFALGDLLDARDSAVRASLGFPDESEDML